MKDIKNMSDQLKQMDLKGGIQDVESIKMRRELEKRLNAMQENYKMILLEIARLQEEERTSTKKGANKLILQENEKASNDDNNNKTDNANNLSLLA